MRQRARPTHGARPPSVAARQPSVRHGSAHAWAMGAQPQTRSAADALSRTLAQPHARSAHTRSAPKQSPSSASAVGTVTMVVGTPTSRRAAVVGVVRSVRR